MNKKDLIKHVSNKVMITEMDSSTIIDVFLSGMREALKKGEVVKLKDFGSFNLQKRKARTALNPKNQEVINVPEKIVIKFIMSKKLKNMINI